MPKPDPCRRPGASSKLENLDGLAVDPSADGLGVNNRLIARRVHQLPANAPARRAPAVRHGQARSWRTRASSSCCDWAHAFSRRAAVCRCGPAGCCLRLVTCLKKLAAYGVIGKARGTLVGHCSRGTVYQAPIHEPRHGNGPPTGSNESAGADAKKPFAVLDKAVSDRADPGNR